MLVSRVYGDLILTSKTVEKLPYQLFLSHKQQTTKGILPHFHIRKQ